MTRGRHDPDPEWYDWVAVARALDGIPVGRPLHYAERVAVARRVRADGDGFNRLMGIFGCSSRTARRLFAEANTSTDRSGVSA